MDQVLDTTAFGEFVPTNILSNGHVSSSAKVYLGKNPVRIFPSRSDQDIGKREPCMEFTKFTVKRKKAKIQLTYLDSHLSVNFKKIKGNWEIKTMTHKEGTRSYKHTRF